MKRIIIFLAKLIKEVKKDNISSISNELTYKLLLALFPFLIFLISFLGFLNIDSAIIITQAEQSLPKEAMKIIYVFINEVINVKSPEILSTSLIVSIFSASSGFDSVVKGINRAYGDEVKKGFIRSKILSVCLVLIFTITIAFSILVLIFGDKLKEIFMKVEIPKYILESVFSFSSYLFTLILLLFSVMLIYKLAAYRKTSFNSVFPGAFVTIIFWVISSKIFNMYINNFSKFSTIYGSIGSVFILMMWLNLISYFLLLGSEINALLLKG